MSGIKRAGSIHGVGSPLAYAQEHRLAIAKKRLRGMMIVEHLSETPVAARVDAGRWLIDCECGAGNAADPDWPEARCFGCGAVHTTVIFPDDVPDLETALVEAAVREQFWTPGESLKTVEARLDHRVGILVEDKEPS